MSLSKEQKSPDGRAYGEEKDYGPYTPEDLETVKRLAEEVGTQAARGFIIVVKKTDLESKGDTEQAEIEGMVKVSKVNRKFMLDTIFHSLGMDNKAIMEYMTMRTVVGSDFDDGDD